MIQVSLDLLVTAIFNVLILAIGACYVLRNGDKGKDPSTSLAKSVDAPAGAAASAPEAHDEDNAAGQEAQSRHASDDAGSGAAVSSDSVAGAAVAAAPEEAAPSKSRETYRGTVKRFSQKNGMGFITCDETRKFYNIDVRIFRDEFSAAGLQVGDEVEFHIVLGGRVGVPRQHPVATGVRKAAVRKEEHSAAAGGGGLQDELTQRRGTSLRASAEEFVPLTAASGSRLSANAVEFVPGAPEAAVASCEVCSTGLNANAAEFVPTAIAVSDNTPVDSLHSGLRADADEYIPTGTCVWNEDYLEE